MNATTRENLALNIGQVIYEELAPLLEGAAQDLKDYGLVIGRDMVLALHLGDAAWSTELKAQAKALLEVYRIRAEERSWQAAEKVLGIIFKTAFAWALALV